MTEREGEQTGRRSVSAPTGDPTGSYRSEALFRGRQAIGIHHRGQHYVLRITRQGKLILNKSNEVGNEPGDET